MKKQIYKWHKLLSLTIAIPIILWAASGIMHPLMTNIKPQLGIQHYMAPKLDTAKISIPVSTVLLQHHLHAVHQIRFVQIDNHPFYQVQITPHTTARYFSTEDGKELLDGDALYARHLAKYFLTGPKHHSAAGKQMADRNKDAIHFLSQPSESASDCCEKTTTAVMEDIPSAPIKSVAQIQAFDSEYKSINKLLPVQKVSFAKEDGIRIYVETTQDRLAFAMDNKRAIFDTLFQLFHTMSWLSFLGKGQFIVEAILMFMSMLAGILGLYIFFATKSKVVPGNKTVAAKNLHRTTSLFASIFFLLFSISGGYHALSKLKTDDRYDYFTQRAMQAELLQYNWPQILAAVPQGRVIKNVQWVEMNQQLYYQIYHLDPNAKHQPKKNTGGEKKMSVPPPSTIYVQVSTGKVLQDGEAIYANYLAQQFSGNAEKLKTGQSVITAFEGEYGFVNKRLPVWKVGYSNNYNERWYVETGSGVLAAKVNDVDLIEGYSFSLLHKHHFMDFGGKTTRDISTLFWAAMQILMAGVGLRFWWIKRQSKRVANV